MKTAEEIVQNYPEVFQRELGTLLGTVHLEVDPQLPLPPYPAVCSLHSKVNLNKNWFASSNSRFLLR